MRRLLLLLLASGMLAGQAPGPASAETEVVYWYHFDDPAKNLDALIEQFEAANPGITIRAENIPWGGGSDYYNRLFTALIGDRAPDAAMVKLNQQARLLEMEALEPLDAWIADWAAAQDIPEDLWRLNRSPDGQQHYLPLQYVVLYLYYRPSMLEAAGVAVPTDFDSFLAAAKATTRDGVYGFGMRGGGGGHDHWATFVLGGGASLEPGGVVAEPALAANRWFVDLHRVHGVFPPSAPTDGFSQIIDNFKSGRTAMTIHHIGSANGMVEALGDDVSAAPVPRGPDGGGWTAFGDESNAVFAGSDVKEEAWKWISFLSEAEANVAFTELTGQLTVTTSGAAEWDLHPARFVEATMASLPIADVLPAVPETAEFTSSLWPTQMQRALLGEIEPDELMQRIEAHFHGQ